MPYKCEKTPMKREKDRRVKLTDEQRDEIAANKDGLSQRALAAKYGVSRRTITFILDPEKHKRNLECRKQRGGWSQYYDTNSHTEAIRTHRRYKHILSKHPNASLCDKCWHMWEGTETCPLCTKVEGGWMTKEPIRT